MKIPKPDDHMTNSSVSSLMEEMAVLLELAGENPFRVRAYQKATQVVNGLTKELKNIPGEDLIKIQGIGSKISSHIQEILTTGAFSEFASLKKKNPQRASGYNKDPWHRTQAGQIPV